MAAAMIGRLQPKETQEGYTMKFTKRDFAITVAGAMLAASLAGTAVAAEQPRMDAAIKYLKEARKELSQANTNKGGHRRQAMDLIDQAIQQVENGKRYANNH